MKIDIKKMALKPALMLGSAVALSASMTMQANAKEFVIGMQCDRSGPTQNVAPG